VVNPKMFITECPRDAMQGIQAFIPTEVKIEYLNLLLECGFDRLDFGSFVSPKAIPQMRDTEEVLLNLNPSETALLAIVANTKGVDQAVQFNRVTFVGFPFSISEQFQIRNTNATILQSRETLKVIAKQVSEAGKKLQVYLSMGFGNPYGDFWSSSLVLDQARYLSEELGIEHLALSDTIGCASPSQIEEIFSLVHSNLPDVKLGLHLHATPNNAENLVLASVAAGCQNMDSALLGFGGCPMAKDDLTGNIDTETILRICISKGIQTNINEKAITQAINMANNIFNTYK